MTLGREGNILLSSSKPDSWLNQRICLLRKDYNRANISKRCGNFLNQQNVMACSGQCFSSSPCIFLLLKFSKLQMNGFFQSDLKLGKKTCKSAAKAKESSEKTLGTVSCGESLPARLNFRKKAERKVRICFHHKKWKKKGIITFIRYTYSIPLVYRWQ